MIEEWPRLLQVAAASILVANVILRPQESLGLKCLYGQQGFYSYGTSILCKKVF